MKPGEFALRYNRCVIDTNPDVPVPGRPIHAALSKINKQGDGASLTSAAAEDGDARAHCSTQVGNDSGNATVHNNNTPQQQTLKQQQPRAPGPLRSSATSAAAPAAVRPPPAPASSCGQRQRCRRADMRTKYGTPTMHPQLGGCHSHPNRLRNCSGSFLTACQLLSRFPYSFSK